MSEAAAIDQNFNLHSRYIPSETDGMQVFHKRGFSYVDSGLSSDSFNIVHISDGRYLHEEDLREAIEYYKKNKLPYCVWVSKHNLLANVKKIFGKMGFFQMNEEPGMSLDLKNFESGSKEMGGRIEIARTEEQVLEFASTLAALTNPPEKNILEYFRRTCEAYLKSKIRLLTYFENDVPVAVMEMFPSNAKTIGFYNLVTLPEFRRKGIAFSMMNFALIKARSDGYEIAILQASQDGKRLYEKIGFKKDTSYFEYQ